MFRLFWGPDSPLLKPLPFGVTTRRNSGTGLLDSSSNHPFSQVPKCSFQGGYILKKMGFFFFAGGGGGVPSSFYSWEIPNHQVIQAVTFLSPKKRRSRLHPLSSVHFCSPSQKGHVFTELPGKGCLKDHPS